MVLSKSFTLFEIFFELLGDIKKMLFKNASELRNRFY